jgi:eukaryotic-like serine/threonine-protein kinase
MGEVYLADDEELGREVALKLLPQGLLADDTARRRFRREALSLSKVNHPHIATLFDFAHEHGSDVLVMEYLPGVTLANRIGQGAVPEAQAAEFALQFVSALEEAHHHNLIHCDLKPSNLIFNTTGQLKIVDFGVARLVSPAPEDITSTAPGPGFAGTLPYMAPEQIRGEPLDGRTDIYAAGVVLYEMVTGKRPFPEVPIGNLVEAILAGPLTSPSRLHPSLSPEFERIILKCLERDPRDRYQSAKELTVDLRRFTRPSTTVTQLSRAKSRPRWLFPVAGLLVLVAIGWTFAAWRATSRRAAAAGSVDSVVALPSRVVGTQEDAFLSDAVPNSLSAQLGQIQGLDVKVPPTQIERDRLGGDLAVLAKTYGVGAFVLSSIVAEGERLVLNVQLVETQSQRLLWSRDYEGVRGHYLALAKDAADGLRAAIRPDLAPLNVLENTSQNSAAELAFQRGVYISNRYNNLHEPADFERAMAAFKEALALDATFADAAAEIGMLYVFKREAGAPFEQVLPEILRWARRAVDLNPRTSRGWDLLSEDPSDPNKALTYSLRAVTVGERDAFAHNGLGLTLGGRSVTLALAAYLESSRLDPLYFYPRLNAAFSLMLLGRWQEALEATDAVLRIEPNIPLASVNKVRALIGLGRERDALSLLTQLQRLQSSGRISPTYLTFLTDIPNAAISAGHRRDELMNQLVLKVAKSPPRDRHLLYLWLMRYGRGSAVLHLLENDKEGVPFDLLVLAPEFNEIRHDPRFVRATTRARDKFDKLLGALQEAGVRGELPKYLETAVGALRKKLSNPSRESSMGVPSGSLGDPQGQARHCLVPMTPTRAGLMAQVTETSS